jgi:hypothetical protein
VACFRTLKAQSEAYQVPEDPPAVVEEPAPAAEVLSAPKPLKRLQDLKWPPEPDAALWNEPLSRNDPKPLRQDQFLAIGPSFSLA